MLLTLSSNAAPFKQTKVTNEVQIEAARGIIERTTPTISKRFRLEIIPQDKGLDVYEFESDQNKIVLRGNNGVSLASAYHRYLKDYCKLHISWNGNQLNIPKILPKVPKKVRTVCPHKYRVYFNYCTLNYTASWWDWKRWEREIDIMAMNGINMPLGVIGLEGAWYHTLLKFGFSDLEARKFLVPPTHFAWQWMTNIQGDKEPLPKEWIDKRIVLGQQMLERQRALGMTPIQQGFTGYVPRELKAKFPNANIVKEHSWCGFEGTAQLDPLDPLFDKIGKVFLETEIELFGTSHVYAADPFHEGAPPQPGKAYLSKVGKAIDTLITNTDPKATIVMQAWSIRKEICEAFPKTRLIVLDLAGRRSDFWGYRYVKGQLHNFGGRINLHGDLNYVAKNPFATAVKNDNLCVGMGLFPESIEQNPVFYNMVFDMIWRNNSVNTINWVEDYALRRYGKFSENAKKAWNILLKGPYKPGTNGVEFSSIIAARPALVPKKSGPNAGFKIPYDPQELIKAWGLLLADYPLLKDSKGYQFDLMDIGRQVLSNLGQELHKDVKMAFQSQDKKAFNKATKRFLTLLEDTDRLLSPTTTHNYGKWISDARAWSKDKATQDYYERNAGMLLTIWGPSDNPLIFDYSWREWSGLIKLYYLPRWQKFYAYLGGLLDKGESYSDPTRRTHGREALRANDFYSKLADWEIAWNKKHHALPSGPVGDPIKLARYMFRKYTPIAKEIYSEARNERLVKFAQKLKKEEERIHGKKIGSWNLKNLSTAWKTVTYDISKALDDAGDYEVIFKNLKGRDRLDVRKVSLWSNGTKINEDVHNGSTGRTHNKNSYVVKLKDFAFNTKYEIRAEIKAQKSTNTQGEVRLLKK